MVTPAGHYALSVRRGEWIFVAGQTGEDESGKLGDLASQTKQAIANVATVLAAEGASLTDVVRMTCYLPQIEDFETFDKAYAEALEGAAPARTTVGCAGLAAGELVEIEATAYVANP